MVNVILAWLLIAGADPQKVDFLREVRPLLSDRCFACHGPDEPARKAGLRLDTRDGALAELKSGTRAIVPGNPAASELVARIRAHDPEEVMPPPQLKRPLTAEELSIMERWVQEGAEYRPHWAFTAPEKPAVPTVRTPGWVRDPVDAFVLEALERAELQPEEEAYRDAWLRRASMVLTGLPPTRAEVDEFQNDTGADAYERRVDRMLASQRSAEHMAVGWLDLARFADTWGYQTDGAMFSWPWRDWLLNALHQNMPYDELVTRMIAGDQLPDASTQDRVASAFSRLHRLTEEGGSIPEEFRQEGIADRVSTFGTTFLGLTLECARCHDHKYDPIPTREFYGLASLFGRVDENGLKPYTIYTSAPPPFVRLMDSGQAQAVASARRNLARVRIEERASATAEEAPVLVGHYPFEVLENNTTPNLAGGAQPASTDRKRPEQLGSVRLGAGKAGQALELDGDGGLGLTGLSGFTRHDPVSIAMWVKPTERHAKAALVHAAGFYSLDADSSGIELELVDGCVRWSVIHLWPGSAASVRLPGALPLGEWTHITATYDGSSRADGLRLYVNGLLATVETVRDSLDGPITTHQLELGSRSRGSGFRGGAVDELKIWRGCLTSSAVAAEHGAAPHPEHSCESRTSPRIREAERVLCAQLDACPSFVTMQDSADAPPTYVLKRGAYDQPDTTRPLSTGGLAAVFAPMQGAPRTRMELARWTCDPKNPLTARVAVNRLWAQVFGAPLVATPENFGWQGAWPSNPALLDALAWDFANGDGSPGSRWNQKHILRRLVLSAAFRQSAFISPTKRARDPGNTLISRGPSQRLSAEMLRDQALAVSGLLVEQFGGPSVKPYQPPGLWNEAGQSGEYSPDTGANAHRRSLYTFRKRAAPPPNQLIFDAGARESCMPRRSSTNTPLQALVLANDPVYFECAQALARNIMAEHSEWNERIALAFRQVALREAEADEYRILRSLLLDQIEHFRGNLEACKQVGGSEDPEPAAFVIMCSTILCSDTAVVVR